MSNRSAYLKTFSAKGRVYSYFLTAERNERGSPIYVRMPDTGTKEFKAKYDELVATRKRAASIPRTIGRLFAAYEASPEFARLSPVSRENYIRTLRPLWEGASLMVVDALSPEDCERIAPSGGGPRSNFLRHVTRLYNWARAKGYSSLSESPAEKLMPRRERAEEWVYFIGSGPMDPIKIGRAVNVAERLRNLQSGNPNNLVVMAKFATLSGHAEERRLLALFASHRLRGEWFAPHPDILAEIARLQEPTP